MVRAGTSTQVGSVASRDRARSGGANNEKKVGDCRLHRDSAACQHRYGHRLQGCADTLVGTWKLNLAKSSWRKIPAPKEDTLVVTQDDAKGLKWTASGVSADGESFSYSFEGAADGRDYPMKSPNNEAVIGFTRAYSRIGATLQAVDKKNGSVNPDQHNHSFK